MRAVARQLRGSVGHTVSFSGAEIARTEQGRNMDLLWTISSVIPITHLHHCAGATPSAETQTQIHIFVTAGFNSHRARNFTIASPFLFGGQIY